MVLKTSEFVNKDLAVAKVREFPPEERKIKIVQNQLSVSEEKEP